MPPYTFTLDDVSIESEDMIASFDVLPSGDYEVSVTDQSGCSTVVTATVDCNSVEPDVFRLSVPNQIVESGDYFCLPITADNFNDISGIQFTLQWDREVLQFEHVNEDNLLGEVSASEEALADAYIRYVWVTTNNTGETFPDGTVIGEVCFTAIGEPGSSTFVQFVDDPIPLEVIDAVLEPVEAIASPGIVSITGEQETGAELFVASDEVTLQDEQVCVDVSVNNFNDILSFQYSMAWDPTVLAYESVGLSDNLENFTSANFGEIEVQNGVLSVSWYDIETTTGVSLPDNSLIYSVCFTAIGEEGSSSPFVLQIARP